jgi:hypothetical protein
VFSFVMSARLIKLSPNNAGTILLKTVR